MATWYSSTIGSGDQTGTKAVYPTINLDPAVVPADRTRGVYASVVKLNGVLYKGAAYFGPRVVKDETHDVLEIYLLDFSGNVYGQHVEFTLQAFIRPVMDFPSLSALKAQVTKDIVDVTAALAQEDFSKSETDQ